MDNNMVDIIVPILQRMQADMAETNRRLGRIEGRVDDISAELSAFKGMTEARFIGLEHAVLGISARTYKTEQRVTAIERRLDEPKP